MLQHLSFSVMDGEQVTLAGRTGAGKSTILKLLLGLYEPQSGAVLIHGVPAVAIADEKRRRLFGYVEQSFHMVPGTVRDQITLYDTTISDEAAQMAARLTGLDEAIRELEKGYDTICTPEPVSYTHLDAARCRHGWLLHFRSRMRYQKHANSFGRENCRRSHPDDSSSCRFGRCSRCGGT